jgi:hypothetical protein
MISDFKFQILIFHTLINRKAQDIGGIARLPLFIEQKNMGQAHKLDSSLSHQNRHVLNCVANLNLIGSIQIQTFDVFIILDVPVYAFFQFTMP